MFFLNGTGGIGDGIGAARDLRSCSPTQGDYHELRDLIAERDEDFARGFSEALIEYALGRPFEFIDEELASTMVASAKKKQYSLIELVQALVKSESFQRK